MANHSFKQIQVELNKSKYDILVGKDILNEVTNFIPEGTKKLAVITQKNIGIMPDLHGYDVTELYVENSENAKSLANVEKLCERLAEEGFHRNDMLIAVGGGVVTDLSGFVASVYNRGINFINIATTLLAQVDAAIGGKTGVNLSVGKNLVGAFWQPLCVINDLDTLATLPEIEMSNGYGEIAKYSLIGAGNFDGLSIQEIVFKCAQFKADVVKEDEFEITGRRAILNYGHTLAHAIELVALNSVLPGQRPKLNHGQAVAVGIAFEAHLAQKLGRIDSAEVSRQIETLESYSLPTKIPSELKTDATELIEFMFKDKKSTGTLAFVLDGPNGPELVKDIDVDKVSITLEEFFKS